MNIQPTAYRQLWELLRVHRLLLLSLGGLAVCSTVVEGVGVGALLMLLRTGPVQGNFLPELSFLVTANQYLSTLSLLERIRLAAAGLVTIAVLRGVLMYAVHIVAVMLQARVENALRTRAFQQVLEVQLAFAQREGQSRQLEVLLHHTQQVGTAIHLVALMLSHVVTVAMYVTVLMLLTWQLTILAFLLFVGVTLLVEWNFARPLKQLMAHRERLQRRVHAEFFNALTGLHLIHLYAQEKRMLARLTEMQKSAYGAILQAGRLLYLRTPLFTTLIALCMASLLAAATVILPEAPEVWLAQVVFFFVVVFRLLAPVGALNFAQTQIRGNVPSVQAVLAFLRRDDKPYLHDGQRPFVQLHDGITFEQVTFRYEAREEPVLHAVSFAIPRGKKIAVVGPSGAGKSTLVHLLTRLYDCEAGRVAVDGVDVRELEIASWRRQLAVVSQDTFIFNDTVLMNLRFVRPSATEEEVMAAARLAQAHEFIMALPQGYETMLGDRGVRLSGGQQQRLAIARALLVDPQLLILDEATSDLDTETEQAIQLALIEYGHHRTVFVIAHRLSTIRQADAIIVLQNGCVVESGTHDDLMQAQSVYWRLVQAQHPEAGTPTVSFMRARADGATSLKTREL